MDAPLAAIYGGRCAWCREAGPGYAHKDHISAYAKSRDNTFDNVWHLCPNCHLWRKPVVELFMGEQALHKMQGLWRSWHIAKAELKSLLKDRCFTEIASSLPQFYDLINYCGAYRDVCDFLERILPVALNGASEEEQLAMAPVRCFVAQLWDRRKEVNRAEIHLRAVIALCKRLTLLETDKILGEARIHLAHALTKKETPESWREARLILDGQDGPVLTMETGLMNRMHLDCKQGNHDSVVALFKQYMGKRAKRYPSLACAIVGSSFFQAAASNGDYESGREYDEQAFRFALADGNPREILLRGFDVQRSWERKDITLGAEALCFSRAFIFAGTGLDETCRERLEDGAGLRDGVREKEVELYETRTLIKRYSHLLEVADSGCGSDFL